MEENEFFSGVILIVDLQRKSSSLIVVAEQTVSGQSLVLWILYRAAKHRISLCNACAPQ